MNAQDIQKGFNSGYFLKSNAPKLAQRYAKVLADRKDGYAVGFTAGIKEYDKEKNKDRYKSRGKNYDIGKISTKPKIRTKDKDKGIGIGD